MTADLNPDPALCAALRADLRDAGYTADAVRAAWGPLADEAVGHGLHGPALAALAAQAAEAARAAGSQVVPDAAAVLARLLFLGVRTPGASVDAALPTVGSAGLVALGLATIDGADVVPQALVRPQDFVDAGGVGGVRGSVAAGGAGAAPDAGAGTSTGATGGDWWVASDLDEAALGGALPTGHVLGVGGASLTLAGLQLPTSAGRVLDLGTGCGIQALRARRFADAVVATDVSARALAFTRLNALLNDVDGIEVREGSLFEPVRGELFDRVVSNPPFVITPRRADVPAYEYRDAGFAGDDLVAAFVTGVGEVLTPGGTAQLLGNWEYRADVDGLDRVRGWVDASPVPLDAWVIERERLDPLAYAELWVRDGGTAPGTPGYAALVEAWLDDFAARGVTEVGFGYLVLRRAASGTPTLRRFERVSQPLGEGLGAHVAEALAASDLIDGLDDAALAATTLTVAGDVTEARHHLPGAEAPSVIELRQGGGLARTIEVDPALAALVGACDGDLAVGPLIDAIAQLLEVDATALRADLLPRVRELVFTGFLTLPRR
ncbi:MAG: SAM-dependent methyltransferase [Microbacterium sp. SCN 70-200]|uniref:class I SAM-dependent methyltransferase n=1 Tax=unclassified Microbacterium TaxID=2609290 RepID=UPI00086C1B96|nr:MULTISPECIES: class I SAM-dependent methyltransferase [unclassified Microbacterium]MBN9216164.1 class I SAM-dependent methyltransferase [Microbacterium sp.]ODT39643.1 MAG: SAM-dependent methyltransferase [Microbacterium sp. SCN 70-200]OJV81433.1 MAG: SAM-dependent methyltransferase [Microbacterium sp. 70-16]